MSAPSSSRMLSVTLEAMNSRTSSGTVRGLALELLLQDGQAGLELGGLDVGDEPGQEAAAEPVLEGGDGLGGPVRGEHDLARRAVEVVEGVEELLLERFFVLHELDVVDEQDVALAVAALEGRGGVVPDGVDELVQEGLGGDVADAAAGEVLPDVVPDGVQEVGLAQPGVPVDEQGVVGLGRHLRHGLGRGVGEAVRRPDDEGVEGVAGVEAPHVAVVGDGPAAPGAARPGVALVRGVEELGAVRSSSRSEVSGNGSATAMGPTSSRTLTCVRRHIGGGRRDQPQEAVLDPVAHQRAGRAEDEEVAVVGLGAERLEPGPPGGVGHLLAQRVSTALPQVVHVVHQGLRHPAAKSVHKQIHRCGLFGKLSAVHLRPVCLVALGKEDPVARRGTVR